MRKDDLVTKGDLEDMFQKFGDTITNKIVTRVVNSDKLVDNIVDKVANSDRLVDKIGDRVVNSDKLVNNIILKIKPVIKETIHEEFTNNTFKITPMKA